MIAVVIPEAADIPVVTAKPIAIGRATMATVRPAATSLAISDLFFGKSSLDK
jgi:hypothetical protein